MLSGGAGNAKPFGARAAARQMAQVRQNLHPPGELRVGHWAANDNGLLTASFIRVTIADRRTVSDCRGPLRLKPTPMPWPSKRLTTRGIGLRFTRRKECRRCGVLKTTQGRLAEQLGVAELKIVETVEQAPHGGASHRVVMAVIQWTIVVIFLLGAAYWLLA